MMSLGMNLSPKRDFCASRTNKKMMCVQLEGLQVKNYCRYSSRCPQHPQ